MQYPVAQVSTLVPLDVKSIGIYGKQAIVIFCLIILSSDKLGDRSWHDLEVRSRHTFPFMHLTRLELKKIKFQRKTTKRAYLTASGKVPSTQ